MINHKRLRELREQLGMTQAELATRVGLTQTGYSVIEVGKRDGSVKTLQAICRELGVPVGEVLG